MLVAVLCTAFAGQAWGQTAAVDDVLWTEPFQGTNASSSFSATSSWGSYINPTTFVSSDASSLVYSSSNAMLSSATSTNMSGAHVWLNKSVDGYIQVAGIKLYNATKVKVSWAQATSGSSTTVSYQFDGEGDFTALSTCSGPNANFESDELSVSDHTTITLKFAHPKSNSKNTRIDNLTLTVTEIATAAGTTAAPTISGNTPFSNNTTVTITNAASADGAAIFYTLNGDDPTTTASATCFAYSAPFTVEATTTVKAIAKHEDDKNASSVVSETFTKISPMTVSAALTAIAALANNGTIDDQCVSGIVCTAGASLSSGAITYYISADGTETNRLQVYRGKGLYNAAFEAAGDIAVGDEVVVYGTLKKYYSGGVTTPEFDAGSYLLSQVTKPDPTFSLDKSDATLDAYTHETVDVTLTTNTDGAITCVSSNTDVATVALKSAGVYTITAQAEGSATITIRSAASANYKSASATVAITVEDGRTDAGISFAEDEEETTWGESYSTQALTNTNSVAVTWSSTDETVATVNGSTGAITILKAGSTTIKATFAGNATYKAAVASYTLTVNKAEAGISYSETSFDVELNDDSFVAPTLNNPNLLEGITYASNNGAVATVNASTGALSLVTTAEGTVKITATFAGNDNYKSGSANYTITVIDPTRKGSKLNPYTVAEVEGQATATTFGDDIYVTGYIVGSVKDNKCYKTTANKMVDTNLLLADTPDVSFAEGAAVASDEDGLIPVELPSSPSSIRTNWGPASNAVIGYKVVLQGDAKSYFSSKGIKGTSEISAVSVGVSVGAAGYTTITTKCPTSFEGTGVTAYKATAINPSTIHLEAIDEAPAGEALVIKASAGLHTDITILPSAAEINDNILKSSDGSVTGNGTSIYALGVGKADPYVDVVGFYLVNSGQKVPKGKAYLNTGALVKEFLTFDFDDATAIAKIQDSGSKIQDSEIFNLAGQKMSKLQKGVNIVNGKKVLVK